MQPEQQDLTARNQIFIWFPWMLVCYEITQYLANDLYLPALPYIISDLDTTPYWAQQTLTAWFLGSASLQLLLGPLSDRWGRRSVLLGGGLLFILSTWICACSAEIYTLLIARFFQGCAVCTIATAGYASVHETYDRIRAIQIFSVMGSITLLAPAFGPCLGSILLLWLSWRWIFGLLVIWGIIGWCVLYRWMPESHPPENRQPFRMRILISHYHAIFRNPVFILNTMMNGLFYLAIITWIATAPFWVMMTFEQPSWVFGLYQFLIFGAFIVGSQCVKYGAQRILPDRLIHAGLSLTSLAALLAVTITAYAPDALPGLVACMMVFSLGTALLYAPAQRLAVESCTEPMGTRMAISSTLMCLFGVTGGLLANLTYSRSLFYFAVLLLILSVLSIMVRKMALKSQGERTCIEQNA